MKMGKLRNLACKKKYAKPFISATSSYINQEYLLGGGLRAWAVALLTLCVCWTQVAHVCLGLQESCAWLSCAGAPGQGEVTPVLAACWVSVAVCTFLLLTEEFHSGRHPRRLGMGNTLVFQGVCSRLCAPS